MDREQLEEEVFRRLRIGKPPDEPLIRDALKMKPTEELEDILDRMKKEGR